MKAIDLYKFIEKNSIEYHWHDGDVILFVENFHIDKWNRLLGSHILDEDGLKCVMKDGYFCFDMKYICDCFDIELTEIFEKHE